MRCFLDIDGVLADFIGGINKVFGLPKEYPPPGQDGLPRWNWYEYYGLTSQHVNAACDINFWANLKWTPDGKQIIDTVEAKFDDIYLLTTPMPHPGSWTGKILWIERHLPKYKKRAIITQAPKFLFAEPNTILIDDKDENIDEFVTAGGLGILVPRPWNELAGWADKTLEVVQNSLETLL